MNESVSILILCAGKQARFRVRGCRFKQLLPFDGERLLDRTVRQILEITNPFVAPCVVAWTETLRSDGCSFFAPPRCRWTCETILSSQPLWQQRTIILLGDVRYTDQAMRIIIGNENLLAFFTDTADFFGLSFHESVHGALKDHLEETVRKAATKLIPDAPIVELYRTMHCPHGLQIFIDDETQDFDRAYEYTAFQAGFRKNVLFQMARCGAGL